MGNSLHEEQLEIIKMLGDLYALNTGLDEERDLVCMTFGEIIASHAAAVDFVSGATRVILPRRFSTIVTSSAGYPLDKTYDQTIKGMVTPLDILEPGGTLIMVFECSEGFGSNEFRDAQTRLPALSGRDRSGRDGRSPCQRPWRAGLGTDDLRAHLRRLRRGGGRSHGARCHAGELRPGPRRLPHRNGYGAACAALWILHGLASVTASGRAP